MSTKTRVIVIGGGIGGMAAAAELGSLGYEVILLEKNSKLGGKLNEIEADGYRFDTGPSLITMPEVLEELFDRTGLPESDRPQLVPLDPLCRYFWQDGTQFDCSGSLPKTLSEIHRFFPDDETGFVKFLGHSADLYSKTAETFLFNPLHQLSDFKSLKWSDVFQINATKTVSDVVDKYVQSRYLRQFFKRFTTYNGSSPYQAPATLNVIPYVELAMGGWYVRGGLYRVAESLEKALEVNGVTIKTDFEVTSVRVNNGNITAVESKSGEVLDTDILVANSDATETYLNLLPEKSIPGSARRKIRRLEPSCSGFVLLLGTDKQWDMLDHHNIFFSDDYQEEFDDIFSKKQFPADPTIYVANSSATDAQHAPEDGSNLFVLINAPYLHSGLDPAESESYAESVIRMLEDRGLTGLSDHIRYQKIIDPHLFYEWYGSNKGSIYGTSSNSKTAAFKRPRNKSPYIDNLYLCGGSTHPGGGIPLVLLSARHAVNAVTRSDRG